MAGYGPSHDENRNRSRVGWDTVLIWIVVLAAVTFFSSPVFFKTAGY